MVLPRAVRSAFLNSAITGKDVTPEQLLASFYGNMGGIFGRMQGPIGAFTASVRPPSPPDAPKALSFSISQILRG